MAVYLVHSRVGLSADLLVVLMAAMKVDEREYLKVHMMAEKMDNSMAGLKAHRLVEL